MVRPALRSIAEGRVAKLPHDDDSQASFSRVMEIESSWVAIVADMQVEKVRLLVAQ